MAYKDEYEVARLYSEPAFMARVNEQFEGDYELRFNMAPPLFSKRDPNTGQTIAQGWSRGTKREGEQEAVRDIKERGDGK